MISKDDYLQLRDHLPDYPDIEFGFGSPHNLEMREYVEGQNRTIEITCIDCKELILEFREEEGDDTKGRDLDSAG
jgi:hypothetical protein